MKTYLCKKLDMYAQWLAPYYGRRSMPLYSFQDM